MLHFVNAVHRKLAYFFEAIRNEDTSLFFPEQVPNKSLQALHRSLNNLNRIISEVKIRNETSEQYLRALIEHSSTGLLSVDTAGYVEVINRTAKGYAGVQHLAHIRLLEQKCPALFRTLTRMKPGEEQFLKLSTPRGPVNLAIRSSDFQFGTNKLRIFSLQDIRNELEENEIESWQKLIRVMTHEIMNSIAPITSLTHTLGRYFHSEGKPVTPGQLTGEEIRNTIDGLGIIEDRGKGLISFVDSYRKLTRIPQPVFAPLDIATWTQRLTLLYQETCTQKGIRFVSTTAPGLKEVQTDEKLLSQVMVNLIVNALEAVSGPWPADKEPPEITLNVSGTPRGKILISVSDNGSGIDEELMDKIFVPFFTTREGGSGIGLSLSRQIMRKLNGKLSAHSTPGKGSQFIAEL